MTNSNESKQKGYESIDKDDISLSEIMLIFSRRKKVIFYSIICCLLIAILYNFFATPIYESQVIAKKEESSNQNYYDEINNMISMQTMDKLETEIELIKSRTVLDRVINELCLSFTIQEVEFSNGDKLALDYSLMEYNDLLKSDHSKYNRYPRFYRIEIAPAFEGGEYFLQKQINGNFALYNVEKSELIQVSHADTIIEFNPAGIEIIAEWPISQPGDKVYFTLSNLESTVKEIQKMIDVNGIGKTNLAKLTVQSKSPRMAQQLAMKIIEKYREVRLEHKRQTVLYSLDLINNQIRDMKNKLERSEIELTNFKSENQIVFIDESSKDITNFLSNLEIEKIKVELELGDYQNKIKGMKNELSRTGYIDQTYLTPERTDGRGSPFSVLLEQLSNKEIERLVLLQKRKENHPDIITVNEEIAKIKAKLNEYNQNTITAYKIIVKTLQKKRSNLKRLIDQYSAKIERLPDQESQLIKLTRDKNASEKMYTMLLDKREEFRLAELSKMQDIVIVEAAQLPHKPVAPRKLLNIILSIFTGLLIGLSIIILGHIFDKRINSLIDIENNYTIPILTIIPKYNKKLKKRIDNALDSEERLVTLMDDNKIYLEHFRVLAVKLRNFMKNGKKSLLISSCEENTGKTSISINFAISLARKGKRIILIDGDLRKASIAKFLNDSTDSTGLINFLTESIDTSQVIKHFKLEKGIDGKVDYIPAGGSVENSSEILESGKMKALIKELSQKYDQIIIDTPPITRIVDALVLGKIVNDIILVIRPNHTFKDSVSMAVEELEQSDINIVGIVINAGETTKLSRKYRYGYGYGHVYPSNMQSV